MPCIWGQHDNSKIFLKVAILPAGSSRGKISPTQARFFKALVDTGAESTCITKSAADQVGLFPIGRIPVQGVSGVQTHNNYRFQVGFLLGRPINKGGKDILGTLCMFHQDIEGSEFDSGVNDFDVLLGMNILSIGSLKVEGNGTFSFSF